MPSVPSVHVPSSLSAALRMLADGSSHARNLDRDPSEFAVLAKELLAVGCTDDELRFLIDGKYATCIATGAAKKPRRSGRREPISFRASARYVLTPKGRKLARAHDVASLKTKGVAARVAAFEIVFTGRRRASQYKVFVRGKAVL